MTHSIVFLAITHTSYDSIYFPTCTYGSRGYVIEAGAYGYVALEGEIWDKFHEL